MGPKLLVIILFVSSLVSCQTNVSVKKDLMTGLITKGNGISCENVYLSSGVEQLKRNSFTYGEKFYLNFDNTTGFEKQENKVFPGMELLITNRKGDTIMHKPDMYKENSNGIDISPLLLQANITAADPIHSGGKYTFFINIWDKKSTGTYSAEMDFDVQANDKIAINNNNISFDEIYLFSSETGNTIVDNNAKFDEKIYFVFEGLTGFYEEAGKSSIGLSMLAKDSEGNIILEEKDLLVDSNLERSELKKLAPNFIFSSSSIKSPISCEIHIWDKKSDSKIHALAKLNIK